MSAQLVDVVFVNPPTHAGRRRSLPFSLVNQRMILRAAGFSEEFLDLQHLVGQGQLPFPKRFLAAARELIAAHPARLYSFHVITSGGPFAYAVMAMVRELYPEAVIAASGNQLRYLRDELLVAVPSLDAIYVADVEHVVEPLARAAAVHGRGGLAQIGGILWRQKDSWSAGVTLPPLSMDELPHFDPLLVDTGPGDVISLEVGRGCKWACSFCAGKAHGGSRPRCKSPARIVAEAQGLMPLARACRTGFVMFESEHFGDDVRFLSHFSVERQKAGADFLYGCYARADYLDRTRLDLLTGTGCRFIFLGIESASEQVQATTRKKLKISTLLPLVQELVARGIQVGCSLVVGFPDEKPGGAAATLDLAAQLSWAGASIHVGPLRVEPGSALSEQITDEQFLLLEDNEYATAILAAGLSFEDTPPRLAFYAYGAQLPGDDIEVLSKAAAEFCEVLNAMPLTLYLRQQLMDAPPSSILVMLPDLMEAARSSLSEMRKVLFPGINQPSGIAAEFALDYESSVFRRRMGWVSNSFSMMHFQSHYERLRRQPALLIPGSGPEPRADNHSAQ